MPGPAIGSSPADQLILVSDADPSTATLVAQAAKLLRISEAPMMLVVNKLPRRSAQVDLDALGSLVPDAAGMWTVESDPATSARVAEGTFTWRERSAAAGSRSASWPAWSPLSGRRSASPRRFPGWSRGLEDALGRRD